MQPLIASATRARAWLLPMGLMLALGCRPPEASSLPPAKSDWQRIESAKNGPVFRSGDLWMKLEVCTSDIVRVMLAGDASFFQRSTLATEPKRCDPEVKWSLADAGAGAPARAVLETETLQVELDRRTGSLSFSDKVSGLLLEELGRALEPATVQGEATLNVRQSWKPNPDEAFYGLGQHQQGLLDISDFPLDLVQYNTEIVVPMLVSSRGYGILWDNTSFTRWGDLQDFEPISTKQRRYQSTFTADRSGAYVFRTYSSGAIRLDIGGKRVIDHFRQGWLPGKDYARIEIARGQSIQLAMAHEPDMGVDIAELSIKPPATDHSTSLWSHVGDGIDYYFIRGPQLDHVIAGYRKLTGQAPLPPRWAFGLWQSRERYESAQELVQVLAEFRKRRIPIDAIVQDWQFWRPGQWGSHDFDPSRFPEPREWIRKIHEEFNAKLMISVWPKFHAGTDTFRTLQAAGHLYPRNAEEGIKDFRGYRMSYYDAFDAEARAMYWSQLESKLFELGIDAWWLDATEPEVVEGPYPSPEEHRRLYQEYMHPTAMGSGSRMLNAYSLVNSRAIYEGQRKAAPDKRVFILTRSGFAGQQRYASTSWSGDITSTWTAFKKQIPAGLGFTLSGIPYWTMDIGGFAVPRQFQAGNSEEWFELNTRWFQYGSFVPLMRVHGQHPPREMWTMGGDEHVAYQTHVKFTRLRYRLLPYIYALAGNVTHQGGTMMRALVLDFPDDIRVRDITDQFMFGPAFLVNPVTEYRARSRRVVLPESNGGWYDFWSGVHQEGGRTVDAAAPLESMPLYVRAGSIVPVGPELEYTAEKPADPITLYVYTGRDGAFSLYEDDGSSYAYERGEHSAIPLTWHQQTKTLKLGARQGGFEGQLEERTFQVVFVTPTSAHGFSFEPRPTATVVYRGSAVEVTGTGG